jgi:protein gp37
MGKTSIEWTDVTWNPLRGCNRVSPGCQNCYAETIAARFSGEGQPFAGYAEWRTKSGHLIAKGDETLWTPREREGRWTGAVSLIEDKLEEPLRWRKAQRVFVNSMSDLFHKGLRDEDRDRIFAVMAMCGLGDRHLCRRRDCDHEGFDCEQGGSSPMPMPIQTFQVLTKRAEEMHDYLNHADRWELIKEAARRVGWWSEHLDLEDEVNGVKWPLENVHLGVSIEDQDRADERVHQLLRTPAAKRFVSYEPALERVSFAPWLDTTTCDYGLCGFHSYDDDAGEPTCGGHPSRIDWVIVGGESGPGARGFDLAWGRSVIAECKAARVPVFVKQLGARPGGAGEFEYVLRSKKGGDWDEWPADLRVREFPS